MIGMGCLEGIKILDFSHALSAPFASMLLSDMGAEIIKVESPSGDSFRKTGPPFQNGESAYFFSVNRNKKCIAVDLKKPEGIEIVKSIARDVDVVIENFRPGVMDRLGLGYEAINSENGKIIYGSLSAFGDIGPYRDKPGFELIIQSLTGMVDLASEPNGKPSKIQIQIVDLCAGLFLSIAILGALHHRNITGEGQQVKTSLLETSVAMLAQLAGMHLMGAKVPTGMKTRNPLMAPSQTYQTKDSWISVVASPNHWDRVCKALGREEWIEDKTICDASTRVLNYDETENRIEEITRTKTTTEWLKIFELNDVSAAKLNSIEDLFEDPQFKALDMIQTMQHSTAGEIQLLKPPFRMSKTVCKSHLPPPLLGEHTSQVLKKFGLSEDIIEKYKAKGIIAGS